MKQAAGRDMLALQHCADCDRTQYPPRELCGHCLSARLEWREVADMGAKVLADTVLHHSNEAQFRESLPLRVGLVRLDCGSNAVAFLDAESAVGASVRVRARLDEDGRPVLAVGGAVARTQDAGRTALVTGASAGIGRAIAEQLLAKGYDVICLDRQPCPIRHPRLQAVQLDLTDPVATREAAARHPFTVLIHCAGAMRLALLPEVTPADMEALAALHLTAGLLLLQAGLPAMRAARSGRVVLISSRAALGLATRTAYAATKAGMIGMARTWALELAPEHITVNVIAPGPIETDMFHEILPAGDPRVEKLAAGIPARRLGQPEDVARAAMFFVDPANSFITGQTLFVCGGTSIGSLAL